MFRMAPHHKLVLFVCVFVRSFCLFVWLVGLFGLLCCVYVFDCLFVCMFVRWFVFVFDCLLVCLMVLFVCLFVCLFCVRVCFVYVLCMCIIV